MVGTTRAARGVIALLTDFGEQDPFVGMMKGVILSINPHAHVVDVCHRCHPFDVRQAALHLITSVPYFPPGTIFVCVVDPGVGSARQPLAAVAGRYTFIGPDNGVLSWALDRASPRKVVTIRNPRYLRHPVSFTFHGRDVFAPVAAHLSRGVPIRRLGPVVQRWVRLPFPYPMKRGQRWVGEILAIDRFGNLITSFSAADAPLGTSLQGRSAVRSTPHRRLIVEVRGRRIHGLSPSYASVSPGALLAIVGSSGYLEIALREGNAARTLKASLGMKVRLTVNDG